MMKVFVLLTVLLALTSAASLSERELESDSLEMMEDVAAEEGDLALEEEEARVYKGYNGGNRVWYGQ